MVYGKGVKVKSRDERGQGKWQAMFTLSAKRQRQFNMTRVGRVDLKSHATAIGVYFCYRIT